MKLTNKKVRLCGNQEYVNTTTGEVEQFQVIKLEERDFNFHKIWLEHIIHSLDLIGNKKTKLAFWIIDNLKSENLLTMTYRQIADKSGLSIETVKPTMQALLNSNFLKKINNGCYQVNPEVLFKGGHRGRMKVLYDYEQINTETVSETDEEIKNNTLTEVQTYEKCANTRGTIPQNM